MQLGDRIREIRVSKQMKQSDLAEKAGISRVAVGNYERNDRQPTADILKRIATALGVDPNALLEWEQMQYEESVKHQSPFLQYLYSIGYKFEYIADSEHDGVLPANTRRKPSVERDGVRTIFTEEEFARFQEEIRKSVDYQVWQQSQQQKK